MKDLFENFNLDSDLDVTAEEVAGYWIERSNHVISEVEEVNYHCNAMDLLCCWAGISRIDPSLSPEISDLRSRLEEICRGTLTDLTHSSIFFESSDWFRNATVLERYVKVINERPADFSEMEDAIILSEILIEDLDSAELAACALEWMDRFDLADYLWDLIQSCAEWCAEHTETFQGAVSLARSFGKSLKEMKDEDLLNITVIKFINILQSTTDLKNTEILPWITPTEARAMLNLIRQEADVTSGLTKKT